MITFVVSQGQSRNPEKRTLEQAIAADAATIPGAKVAVIPHLYDLAPDSASFAQLRQIEGPLVILSWLYERATRWVFDRNGIRGLHGDVEIKHAVPDEEEDKEDAIEEEKPRVLSERPPPNRSIYCIDLRASESPEPFAQELRRIANLHRPVTDNLPIVNAPSSVDAPADIQRIEDHPQRRWYPVIDYSRCTNCMECIDFCLFGVYGVDGVETILVEQPDNCRKGCPACSRVCPENAIIFPQHKTPAIAGAPVEIGGLKIDLSKLFGAPESGEDAINAAVRERDEQLILSGRSAVGDAVGIRPRNETKDDLDLLLDQLDAANL